jgi:hypothetical protein
MARTGGMSRSSRSTNRHTSILAHTEAQQAVYAAPWLVWFFAGIAAQILHTFVAAEYTWLVEILLFIAGAGCGAAGYFSTHERSTVAITHTLVTIGLGTVWLMFASWLGLFTMKEIWAPLSPTTGEPMFTMKAPWPVPESLLTYIVIGGALCVIWNMRQNRSVREVRQATLFEAPTSPWDDVGLSGVQGKIKKINEFRGEGTWTLPRAMTVDQVQKAAPAIESAFDWPRGSLTIISQNGSSRKVRATVIFKDPLVGGVEYPGVDL